MDQGESRRWGFFNLTRNEAMLKEIDCSLFCGHCGARHSRQDMDGGRCTACGVMLLPYGNNGLFHWCAVTDQGKIKIWAEGENQLRCALKAAGYKTQKVDHIGSCECYVHLPLNDYGGVDVYFNKKHNVGGEVVPRDDWYEHGNSSHRARQRNALLKMASQLIVAHACEGVDIASPAYVAGLASVLDDIEEKS
jgi:hypothetical protein